MKKSHLILVELLELRDKDYEKFMDKLYEAISGELSDVVTNELLKDEVHRESIKMMIEYFEQKEEYEKCDVLLHLLNHRSI
jgi:uncharacterized membrane protein YvbJ